MKTLRTLAAAALIFAAGAAPAQDIIINNARVYLQSGEYSDNAAIVIDGDTITRVDQAIARPSARNVIDATGLTVYPGWFASGTQVGMVEVGAVDAVNDTDERAAPNTAMVRAFDAYNPTYSIVPVQRINGITTAHIMPSRGNVFMGQGAVVSLAHDRADHALVATPVALHVSLGESPKARYGDKNRTPSTRMGLASFIRDEFIAAGEYADKWDRHAEKLARTTADLEAYEEKLAAWQASPEGDEPKRPTPGEPPAMDLKLEPLRQALRGDIPVAWEAHRIDDIDTALRLAEEFGLRSIIMGGSDAYKIAGKLAERDVPVVLNVLQQPGAMEAQGAIYQNAALLHRAGVKVAFRPDDDSHNLRNLPYEAGMAVAYGLPHAEALRAITSNPAEIWGVAETVGSIAPGRLANLVIVDGDPLQPLTPIRHVIIEGQLIELRSRQTDLAKKWGGHLLPDGFFGEE